MDESGFRDIAPMKITFGNNAGILHLTKPMWFEGEVEESARIFIDEVIKKVNNEYKTELAALKQERDRYREALEEISKLEWNTYAQSLACKALKSLEGKE